MIICVLVCSASELVPVHVVEYLLAGLLWYLTPDEFRRVAIAVHAVPAGWHRGAVTK